MRRGSVSGVKLRKLPEGITKIVSDDAISLKVDSEDLNEFLGVKNSASAKSKQKITLVLTGLAWTEVGGELLQVESVKSLERQVCHRKVG